MDMNDVSRALDHVDQTIRQLEKIKRAMQKAYAEGNRRELQILSLTSASLRCQLMTDIPRYFVANEYYTSFSEASEACGAENAKRKPGDKVRVVDILAI